MPRTLTNFTVKKNSNIIQKEDEKSWDKKWIKQIVTITLIESMRWEKLWAVGQKERKYIVNMRWEKLWAVGQKERKFITMEMWGRKGIG